MKAKYLPLLLLGLLPTGSSPPAAGVPDRRVSEEATVVAAAAPEVLQTERCTELRETETALAEQEVHLLDRLAQADASPSDKDAWREELAYAQDALEANDKALEVHRCPTL
jgi:hypothetical protein